MKNTEQVVGGFFNKVRDLKEEQHKIFLDFLEEFNIEDFNRKSFYYKLFFEMTDLVLPKDIAGILEDKKLEKKWMANNDN